MRIILFLLAILACLLIIAIIRTLFVGSKENFYEYSKDKSRVDEYANRLSRLIQYETVSVYNEPNPEKYRGFHSLLAQEFPLVFRVLEKIDIDGNLLMKWKGEDSSLDPIILTSHQDVVEANGEWKYPPFSGTIADGKVWGRGTADIKCGIFAFYQAVEELIEAGYKPKCDVYLGSSCTEEVGGDGATKLANYFKERNINLYLLSDEGGAIAMDPFPGVTGYFAAIGIFEKGYGDIKFSAKGNGGHSSSPSKGTPIAKLAKFENYIEEHNPFIVKFSPAVTGMFESLAPYCKIFALKVIMCNLWLFKPLLKVVLPKVSSEAAAMLKTTCVFTTQKGSDGYNVIPQEAYVTANLRYIPHENMDVANKKIIDIATKFGLESEIIKSSDSSTELDLNGPQYKQIVDVTKKVFPGVGIMPYVVTGGTDSRFYDEVCKNCVRFSPVIFGPEQLSGMHGLNECIEAGCLPGAVDFFKELIKIQETR